MIEMIIEWVKNPLPIDLVFVALIACWIIGLGAAIILKMKFPKPQKSDKYNNSLQYIAESARKSWLAYLLGMAKCLLSYDYWLTCLYCDCSLYKLLYA